MQIVENDFGLVVRMGDREIGSLCEVSPGLWLGIRYRDDDAVIDTKDKAIAFVQVMI